MKKYILFSAEQVGGVDALLPVIKKIQKNKRFKFALFFDNKNIYKYAKKKNIKNLRLFVNPSLNRIEEVIKKENPDVFFTDTNNTEFKDSIDKKIIKISKSIGKPSVSIVDAWMNYKERFGEKLEYLSDYILVIDEEMKNDLENIGISSNIIKITGSPRFDKFSKIKKTKEEKNLIVFYSQPYISEEFSEVDVFKDIVEVVENNYPKKEIIIKFHPSREKNRDKYDYIIKSSRLVIEKAKNDAKSDNLTKKAELIIGINSIALFDAALMGKKVFSYQPGKNTENDVLRSNYYGWSTPAYKKERIAGILKNIFEGKNKFATKLREEYTKNRSTEKVFNLLKTILSLSGNK